MFTKRALFTILVLFFCTGLRSTLHAEFKPEVKFSEVNGVKLAYYIRGEGEPLLLINGFISTMSLSSVSVIANALRLAGRRGNS